MPPNEVPDRNGIGDGLVVDTESGTAAQQGLAVEIVNATVVYPGRSAPGRVVLDKFSLRLQSGEFLALVGKSGCGKTTVLNMLTGTVHPDAGRVEVLGTDPVSARRQIGFMLARDALLPWRSAVRNVEYGLELKGVNRLKRREIALKYLELLGVGHASKLWPWQLSQGMRQRVALARTWAVDPQLLLMDEPFAALDTLTRVTAQREFLRLWSTDMASGHARSVVLVTHDLGEALLLADRVVVLSGGRIIDDVQVTFGRPRDAIELAANAEYLEQLEWLRHRL